MPLNPIPEEDLGKGIDQFHPEHKIPPGFVEDARNFDPTAEGTLRKRVGYQLFGGYVPLRVTSVSRNANILSIVISAPTFALSTMRTSQIIVGGRTPGGSMGLFGTTTISYAAFSSFTTDNNQTLLTSSIGADFASTPFEGSIWGLNPALLNAAQALDADNGTAFDIDHLDYFRNSSVQHPVCAFLGGFYAARSDTAEGSLRPAAQNSRLKLSLTSGIFPFTGVDTALDTITITGHALSTGSAIRATSTISLPAPLVANVDYYAHVVDANTIHVSSSYVNAIAGIYLDLTTAGSGTRNITKSTVIAPLFVQTGEPSPRTRGRIASADALSGWVHGASITYNPSTGFVEFILSMPGMDLLKVDGTAETVLSNLVMAGQDFVNIRDASYSTLNGRHRIQAIATGTDEITISVSIDGIDETDSSTLPDSAGSAGFYAGIFSDRLDYTGIPLLGAQLTNGGIPDTENLYILALLRAPLHVYVGDVADIVIIPYSAAAVMDQTITTNVLPIPTTALSNTWVRGDGLWFGALPVSRRIRVSNLIFAALTQTVTVTSDGATAIITVATSTPFSVGDWFFLSELSGAATAYDGAHQITEIIDGTSFAFATTETETGGSYTLEGSTLGLSEAVEVSSTYDGTFAVPERWVPIEAVPRANTSAPYQTYPTYYSRYSPLTGANNIKFRSIMVAESMYLTDYENVVYKYDGQYLSSAGLPRWQPLLGLAAMANRFNRVLNDDTARAVDALTPFADGTIVLDAPGDAAALSPAPFPAPLPPITYSVRPSGADTVREQNFHVLAVNTANNETSGTADTLRVTPATLQTAVGAPEGRVLRALTRRYYYSLYRLDPNYRAQVSQPASIEDAVVRFGGPAPSTASEAGKPGARIDALLAKPPLYRLFDHRRVEIQSNISTGREGTPVFAQGAILPVDYTSTTQSALTTIQDAATVESLALRGRDNTAKTVLDLLFFTEIGKAPALAPTLDRPPRGRAISTAAGRLLVGNIRSPARSTIAGFIPDDRAITASNIQSRIKLRSNSTTYSFYTYLATDVTNTRSNCTVVGTDASSGLYITLSSAITPGGSPPMTGMWIQIAAPTTSPELARFSMELLGWYQIVDPAPAGYPANTIKVRAPVRAPITITSVDTGTDLFTSATNHQLNVGDPVILRNALGSTADLPTDLATGVMSGQYYAIPISDTTFKLAVSYIFAVAGTFTDVLAAPTATTFAHFVESASTGTRLRIGFPDVSTTTTIPVLVWDLNTAVNPDHINGDSRIGMLDNKEVSKRAVITTMVKDIGRAINAVASGLSVAGTAPFAYCTEMGNDAAAPNSIELEALDPADDFDIAVDFATNSLPEWYINNTLAADNTFVAAPQTVFPSRLARSYKNFPEVFGSPFLIDANNSDSAIDIGEDNGDEIVAVIPRFGDSFSNSALTQGAVVVFKTKAVYLVDVTTKQVAQIDTNGQGCTFPRSVIRTKNGILFANEAGLWKLNESNQCVFLGQILKRYWERQTNRDASEVFDLLCGHHDARRNRAMISTIPVGEVTTSEVVVYDHTRENADDRGSWTLYNNFNVTGWCNAGSDTLFGTAEGSVFALRRTNDESDYQDDVDPVGGYDITGTANGAYAILSEKNFGAAGIRKRIVYVQVGFRTDEGVTTSVIDPIELSASIDHRHVFESLDSFKLVDPHAGAEDNLSGTRNGSITTLQFSLPQQKSEYLQLKIFDDTARRPVEVTDVTYLVEALQPAGVPTAAGTR